jgi:SAM-dependent methyltransferase
MVPYSALASIYQAAGLAEDADRLRQRLFDKIQMEGWLGRRILDLGCGIGNSVCWFSANGFRVTGVDHSPEMLAVARHNAGTLGLALDLREADLAAMDIDDGYDLVLALHVLNELRATRDLEAAFLAANHALSVGKLLLFDLLTIQGFVEHWGIDTRVLFDDPERLMVMVRSEYSYETALNTRHYTVLRRADSGWERQDESHTLRAYSLQTIGSILQRTGFKVQQVIDTTFRPYDPQHDPVGRAVFLAAKTGEA